MNAFSERCAERENPVLISDSGDNPTAGGVGDVTVFSSAPFSCSRPTWFTPAFPMKRSSEAQCIECRQRHGADV